MFNNFFRYRNLFIVSISVIIFISFIFFFIFHNSNLYTDKLIPQDSKSLSLFKSQTNANKLTNSGWQVTKATGTEAQLTFWKSGTDKKVELGWIAPNNNCAGWTDKYLYDINGNRIKDDKNKDISLKCESSKCGGQNCYHISLTNAQAVNIDKYIKIGENSVVIEYVKGDGDYITYLNNITAIWEHTYIGVSKQEFELTISNNLNISRNLSNEFLFDEISHSLDIVNVELYKSENISHPFEDYYECDYEIINKTCIGEPICNNITRHGKNILCGSFIDNNYYYDYIEVPVEIPTEEYNYTYEKCDYINMTIKTNCSNITEIRIRELKDKRITEDLILNPNEIKKFKIVVNGKGHVIGDGFGSEGGMSLDLDNYEFWDKSNSSWWNASWKYNKLITIDNTNMGSNLINFPLLVKFNDEEIGNHSLSTGNDIRFTDSNGVELPYEKQSYSAGVGIFWVKTNLTNTTSTSSQIYIYYGNLTASAGLDGQQAPLVWSNGYVAVWHLQESGTGALNEYKDATGKYNATGAVGKVPVRTSGKFGYAQNFTRVNDQYINTTNSVAHGIGTGNYTIEGFIKPVINSDTLRTIYSNGVYSPALYAPAGGAYNEGSGLIGQYFGGSQYGWTVYMPLAWHHVAVVRAGGTVYLYTNATEDPFSYSVSTSVANAYGRIGEDTLSAEAMNGLMQEVRLSNSARSQQWLKFQFYNMNSVNNELTFSSESGVWANSSYNKRKKIQIDNTNVNSDLTDFPLLVKFNDSDIGVNGSSSGNDIRFYLPNGTALFFERERHVVDAGNYASGIYWVKIPIIKSAIPSSLYIYYKNNTASAGLDGQQATAVWDSNYVAVLHLGETGTGSINDYKDSTGNGNGNTNTANQPIVNSTGIVGNSQGQFNGTQWIQIESLSISSYPQMSVQFWYRPFSTGWCYPVGDEGFLKIDGGSNFRWLTSEDWGGTQTQGPIFTLNKWNLISFIYNGTSKRGYVNTTGGTTVVTSGTFVWNRTRIGGAINSGSLANGNIDEFRISKTGRSVNWIKFEYNNINEADNELTYGAEETGGVAPPSDTEYPQFSNYWDNNGTLTDSGTALFNVTVTSTNGTVWLEINNSNYTASKNNFECYQESANVSTNCGGLNSGNYISSGSWTSVSNAYDGTWSNYATGGTGDGGYLNINYTKPNNSISGKWQVKDTNGERNISIPSSCWNYFNDVVSVRIQSRSVPLNNFTCYDGGWKQISVDVGLNRIYEEAMIWNISYFNTSVNFTKAGLYPYRWWSWGNGTSNNLNKSDERSYTVLEALADTSFSITLPIGTLSALFKAINKSSKYIQPENQTSSVPFLNISNDGNVDLNISMILNSSMPADTILMEDTDNDPIGSIVVSDSGLLIKSSLSSGQTVSVWFWSNVTDVTPGSLQRELNITSIKS